jgi:hypothetical protein
LLRKSIRRIGPDPCSDPVGLLASPAVLFYNACVDPLRDLGRTLVLLGALIASIGALLYFGGKLPFRLGKLPGDIVHRGEHSTFYFPIVTCLVFSAALSFLVWLVSHFRR